MHLPRLFNSVRGGHAPRRSRTWPPLLATLTAAVALLAAPAAAASPAAAQAQQPAQSSRPAADPMTLAAEQARQTGKPVLLPSFTTPTSTTQVMPDGQYRLTTSSRPVRAMTRAGWQALNATLTRNADGTWSPAVSTGSVAISGGGAGPMAVIGEAGRTLRLYWPGTLPAPVVTSDTATYPAVLPGVDLRLTVDGEGGVRDVLVIRDRAAAASPALRRLALTSVATGGLRLIAGSQGSLEVATASGLPAFTSTAPLMWDTATTATPPAAAAGATSGTAAGAAGAVWPTAGLMAPAVSTPARPGRHAHLARVADSVSAPLRAQDGSTRQSLALIPDATMLTSPATVFPVYVDPWLNDPGTENWYASDADGSLADSNKYDATADPAPENYLQVGYNDSFNAHSFVNMGIIPSDLDGAQINSAVIQFTEETSWSCTATPVELSRAGAAPTVSGKPWVSWNDEPSPIKYTGKGALADGAITSQTVAYGHSGCAAAAVNFDLTYFMQSLAPSFPSTVTFELKAPDLNTDSEWKEFSNAAGAITMTTYYDHTPYPDNYSKVSPGGNCQSVSPADTIVGNDDFTLTTTPSDHDGGSLTVTFVVSNDGSATPLVTQVDKGVPSGKSISFQIPRTQVQGWHTDGKSVMYTYSWYSYATDSTGLDNQSATNAGSKAHPCLFTYNPAAPSAPDVVPPASGTDGSIGSLGGTASFTFANCSGSLESPAIACTGTTPVTYVYQVDDGPYKTVAVSGASQPVSIPLTRYGLNTITVSSLSAGGNPSATYPADFTVDEPGTAYPDGDYAGTGNPDLITVGDGKGTTDQPGLWLAESNGTGGLSTPVDIGAQGDGLNTYGSPADWAGAQVLHGDFTGNQVQDIAAYYPAYGALQLVGGPGTAAALSAESGNTWGAAGNPLKDKNLNFGLDTPAQVVAAGNASGNGSSLPDLIGILGDAQKGYELNIYTAPTGDNFSTGYGHATIAASSTTTANGPDGNPWGPNWSLAVAEPPTGPVLFAFDTANGQLWESVAQPANTPTTTCPLASDFLVGMPCSTWTPVTGGAWTSATVLAQADVRPSTAGATAGYLELWTTTAGSATTPSTATAWTLPPPSATAGSTSIALTKGPVTTLGSPGHEWPLTDGPYQASNGGTSLMDTESDSTAAIPSSAGVTTTGYGNAPATDQFLGPVEQFDGGSMGSIILPAGILQDTTSAHAALQSMTLTMRFQASPGKTGILAGTSTGSLTDATLSAKSAPILYIGTDGHLYAQFPSAHVSSNGVVAQDVAPLESSNRVDDGLWHTVALVADGVRHDQFLYLDDNIPIHLWANGFEDSATPATMINPGQVTSTEADGLDQVTIGAGIFSPAGWVNADATGGAKGTTRTSYFTGQIADVAIYPTFLSPAQLPADYPGPVTTAINSGVLSSQCIDNASGTVSNGNPIQIYTCNAQASQNWTFSVNSNGTMAIKYAANPGYCLNVTANGTANGTLIDLNSCNGANGQYWQVLPNGSIMNQGSGKCLDDPLQSTTNGTQLQLYGCNGTIAQTWASLVRPAESPLTGTIVSAATGWCLDNANGSTTSPNKVQVNTCTGTGSEQWTFNANGTVTVDGMCINNTGSNTNDGNTVNATTCNGTGAQVWAHQDNGDLENPQTGKCIQVSTTTLQFGLQLWTCDNDPDQTFIYSSTWNHS